VERPGTGVTEGVTGGWRAVRLTSDTLSVTVLPDKGADIYEIIDLATGIDPLFKAPWGLQPPGAAPREGSDGAAFLENYEGTWQELFPSTNDACSYRGATVPFHGEVAARPWSVSVEASYGGLGPGGVPVDHLLAAVRRRQGHAAARRVRPGHRAVGDRRQPGAGNRRRQRPPPPRSLPAGDAAHRHHRGLVSDRRERAPAAAAAGAVTGSAGL